MIRRGLRELRGIQTPERGDQKRMHGVQSARRGLRELRGIQTPVREVRRPWRGIYFAERQS
ncbi:hypothetical protein [Sporosarcina sp. 6E9]|uniref:hypothetical protein n=1 Tax=Sporosarcina sp. 6E9 TaxID=2819235 RepID=UPI001B3184CB|nr:hypothetical protein [Sporosarcina sp. 6E9]